MLEKLECLRNMKYSLKMSLAPQKFITIDDLCTILQVDVPAHIMPSSKISFFGFYNEFHTVFGKNSVYICFKSWEESFAKKAIRAGAIAVLCDHQIEKLPCIIVPDINNAFDTLCRIFYERHPIPSIAIAGSIGKTTTTQMVHAVYKMSYRTFCAPINGNVLQYLGFLLQHIPSRAQRLIQEIDESFPKNAHRCSKAITPEIAIITNIGKSHIGELGGEAAVLRAITSVTDYMPADGHVIISADDPNSMRASFNQHIHTVAINNSFADCIAKNIKLFPQKTVFDLQYEGQTVQITINCPGIHNVYNAMMAYVSGRLSGIPTQKIVKGLGQYRPSTIRQTTYHAFGKTLYVDCFNASAQSIAAALTVADNMSARRNGRHIAVLGDVLGINGYEKEVYSSIAKSVDSSLTEILITYGSFSSLIWDNLSRSDISGKHLTEKDSLCQYIKQIAKFDDVILFKASGGMEFEGIVRKLYPLTIFLGMIPYYIRHAIWILQTL